MIFISIQKLLAIPEEIRMRNTVVFQYNPLLNMFKKPVNGARNPPETTKILVVIAFVYTTLPIDLSFN